MTSSAEGKEILSDGTRLSKDPDISRLQKQIESMKAKLKNYEDALISGSSDAVNGAARQDEILVELKKYKEIFEGFGLPSPIAPQIGAQISEHKSKITSLQSEFDDIVSKIESQTDVIQKASDKMATLQSAYSSFKRRVARYKKTSESLKQESSNFYSVLPSAVLKRINRHISRNESYYSEEYRAKVEPLKAKLKEKLAELTKISQKPQLQMEFCSHFCVPISPGNFSSVVGSFVSELSPKIMKLKLFESNIIQFKQNAPPYRRSLKARRLEQFPINIAGFKAELKEAFVRNRKASANAQEDVIEDSESLLKRLDNVKAEANLVESKFNDDLKRETEEFNRKLNDLARYKLALEQMITRISRFPPKLVPPDTFPGMDITCTSLTAPLA